MDLRRGLEAGSLPVRLARASSGSLNSRYSNACTRVFSTWTRSVRCQLLPKVAILTVRSRSRSVLLAARTPTLAPLSSGCCCRHRLRVPLLSSCRRRFNPYVVANRYSISCFASWCYIASCPRDLAVFAYVSYALDPSTPTPYPSGHRRASSTLTLLCIALSRLHP